MSSPRLHVIVPGPLAQLTGGYIYDTRMIAGLKYLGWQITVHELSGSFGPADSRAETALSRTLSELPTGERVVIDGLAMGELPGPLQTHHKRLQLLALVHHLLTDETGLTSNERARFAVSEREALTTCIGILVTSNFTAQRLQMVGVPTAHVRTVSPGIDPARPAKGPRPGDPPALLCVGSVIPRKGQDVLIRALAQLKNVAWNCVCVGSLTRAPAYAAAVQDEVWKYNLSDRVSFIGESTSSALDKLYDGSSLFVLPSHYEGYGIALTEAAARGLPIISTTGGAIPDTIPSEVGVLVPPADHDALAKALGLLLSHDSDDSPDSGKSALAKLAKASRAHAMSLPDWSQAARQFANAVLDLTVDGT